MSSFIEQRIILHAIVYPRGMCISSWIIASAVIYVIGLTVVLSCGLDESLSFITGPIGVLLSLGLFALPAIAFIDIYLNTPVPKSVGPTRV